PTTDTTPDYTFSSTESGTITYGGSCSSSTTSAISGNNTITLSSLSDGTYADCTIKVSKTVTTNKSVTNLSDSLTITSFTVSSSDDTTAPTVSSISAFDHTCVLLNNGSVKCWGWNHFGQLGKGTKGNTAHIGDDANEMGDNLTSIDLGTDRTATAIDTGYDHTCALLDNASVKCWGRNVYGALGKGNNDSLGDDANEMGDNLTSIDLGTGRTATAISAGYRHTCALLDNASVKCWGYGAKGQLGLGNTDDIGDGPNEMGDNLTSIDLGTDRTA
ncbi:uncharacterized protein METZ01_LOCUS418636, partial [marine metagenome]